MLTCERKDCGAEMYPHIKIIRIGANAVDVCDNCHKEIEDKVAEILATPPSDKQAKTEPIPFTKTDYNRLSDLYDNTGERL